MTRNEVLLGIDVGTTYSKAVVVALDGRERGRGRVRTSWTPVSTGAEIEPELLIVNAMAAARAALSTAGGGRAAGVGVTSVAETGVLLDARGSPVVPAIVWHDTRGAAQARALEREVGDDEFTSHTGLRVSRMCTAVKYRWMRENWADSGRGVRWLNVAEWVGRGLGSDEISESSLASRTGWLDIARQTPWEVSLEWSQAPPGLLPDPALAGAAVGHVGTSFPEARGATITIAGHDHLCASFGAGATRPGDVFDSCGTAESFVRALEAPVEPAEILRANRGRVSIGRHVRDGQMAAMGGFESGLALQRILDLLGHARARDRLDEGAMAVAPGAGGVEIHGVTEDEVAITGIGRETTAAHLWRAVLEAVQRRGAEVLETLESIGGPRRRLVATGGGLENDAVRRVKLEILGEFVEPAVKEAGARGAALLAGVAAGVYPNITSLPEPGWKKPVSG